jgi:hypothetical protein
MFPERFMWAEQGAVVGGGRRKREEAGGGRKRTLSIHRCIKERKKKSDDGAIRTRARRTQRLSTLARPGAFYSRAPP